MYIWKTDAFWVLTLIFLLQKIKCLFEGNCQINVNTRRFCSYCRLKQCFAAGMKKDLILGQLMLFVDSSMDRDSNFFLQSLWGNLPNVCNGNNSICFVVNNSKKFVPWHRNHLRCRRKKAQNGGREAEQKAAIGGVGFLDDNSCKLNDDSCKLNDNGCILDVDIGNRSHHVFWCPL